jgi:deoxyribodipyrimidine photolyase-related protein
MSAPPLVAIATPDAAPAHTLRLILGDQLNPLHTWFETVDAGVVYTLMEVRQETDTVRHHAQKVLAIFAAMRDFVHQLQAAGHRVHYLTLNVKDTTPKASHTLA